MSLPEVYLQQAEKIKTFNELFHLNMFLWDSLNNDEDEQRSINFERSVLVLSGILTETDFPLENIDKNDLKLYIQSNLDTDNEYRSLLYDISYINLKTKLREFDSNLKELLDSWFVKFNTLSEMLTQDDRSNVIPILLAFYLKLSKNVFDKESYSERLEKIYEFIANFAKSDETIANLCNKELLSLFSTDEKRAIINNFFDFLKKSVEQIKESERSSAFLDNTYLGICFDKLIKYCASSKLDELKHDITDYFICKVMFFIENHKANPMVKLQKLRHCLELSSNHINKDKLRNHILLKTIDVSSEVHASMQNSLEIFEQKMPESYSDQLRKEVKKYEKYNTLDCLSDIAHRFFNSSKFIVGETNSNDFHFTMLASQLLLDEGGLIRGIVSDEDSRIYHDLKQNVIIFIQVNLPLFHSIKEKESYETELLELSVFGTVDDKHIKNAIRNFLDEDYHGFLARSIPLIEKKLRLILRSLGEADIMPNKIGGFDFRPMNAFMSSDVIADNFTKPVRLMFKVLYDDRRGFNLRNKIAHGIVEANEVGYFQALIVLLTLVYLSTVVIEEID